MTVFLAVAVLWLALDFVLVAGWHTAHLVARRAGVTTGRAMAAPTAALQTSYRFDREWTVPACRPRAIAAATVHS